MLEQVGLREGPAKEFFFIKKRARLPLGSWLWVGRPTTMIDQSDWAPILGAPSFRFLGVILLLIHIALLSKVIQSGEQNPPVLLDFQNTVNNL